MNMARKKNLTLTIRLSEYEKRAISTKARNNSLGLSEYVIGTLLSDSDETATRYRALLIGMKDISDKLESLKSANKKSPDFQDILDAQKELKAQLIALSAKNVRYYGQPRIHKGTQKLSDGTQCEGSFRNSSHKHKARLSPHQKRNNSLSEDRARKPDTKNRPHNLYAWI